MTKEISKEPTAEEITLRRGIEDCLSYGMSKEEICAELGITKNEYEKMRRRNPELKELEDILKTKPLIQARKNIVNSIKEGSIETSKWYAERACKEEFSTKILQEIDEKGESLEDKEQGLKKELTDLMKKMNKKK